MSRSLELGILQSAPGIWVSRYWDIHIACRFMGSGLPMVVPAKAT